MLTGRLKPEIGVERSYGPDIVYRGAREAGHFLHRLFRDIPDLILHRQQ
jgi:hypothetical protein